MRAMNTPTHGLPSSIEPQLTWTMSPSADVLTALYSLRAAPGVGKICKYKGDGADTYLAWSGAELIKAQDANSEDLPRHTQQAVSNARRALDCLLDAYLEREYLSVHVGPRPSFAKKLGLLAQRPNLKVPATLIPTIISEPRNRGEHDFESPSLHEAKLAVEAAEAVCSRLREQLDPLLGPVLYGRLNAGSYLSASETYHWFCGFSGEFGLMWRQADGIPRLGVGIMAGKPSSADIICCEISQLTKAEHFELVAWWDKCQDQSYQNEEALRTVLSLAGLNEKPRTS